MTTEGLADDPVDQRYKDFMKDVFEPHRLATSDLAKPQS